MASLPQEPLFLTAEGAPLVLNADYQNIPRSYRPDICATGESLYGVTWVGGDGIFYPGILFPDAPCPDSLLIDVSTDLSPLTLLPQLFRGKGTERFNGWYCASSTGGQSESGSGDGTNGGTCTASKALYVDVATSYAISEKTFTDKRLPDCGADSGLTLYMLDNSRICAASEPITEVNASLVASQPQGADIQAACLPTTNMSYGLLCPLGASIFNITAGADSPAPDTPDSPKPPSDTPDSPKPPSDTPDSPKPPSDTPDSPKPPSDAPEVSASPREPEVNGVATLQAAHSWAPVALTATLSILLPAL